MLLGIIMRTSGMFSISSLFAASFCVCSLLSRCLHLSAHLDVVSSGQFFSLVFFPVLSVVSPLLCCSARLGQSVWSLLVCQIFQTLASE